MTGERCPTCGRGGGMGPLGWVLCTFAMLFVLTLVIGVFAVMYFGARSPGVIGAAEVVPATEGGR